VSSPEIDLARGGGVATAALFGATMVFLGLLGGLPVFLGPAVGAVGVGASAYWRTRPAWRQRSVPFVPAALALAVLSATSPALPSTVLFAGLASLAMLLWIADDPERPAGGGRRAAPVLGPATLGVGLAWAVTLGLAGRGTNVGLAGGLVVVALVLLAFLLAGVPRRPTTPAPTPPPL